MRSIPAGWKLYPGRATASIARRKKRKDNSRKLTSKALQKKGEMLKHLPFFVVNLGWKSVQVEIDFHAKSACHRSSIFFGRIEFPGTDGLDRLLVQAHAQRVHD